jgi:hypothetical protein
MSSLPVSFARFSGAILDSFMENDDGFVHVYGSGSQARDFALCLYLWDG